MIDSMSDFTEGDTISCSFIIAIIMIIISVILIIIVNN